jgi:hypothetical protein
MQKPSPVKTAWSNSMVSRCYAMNVKFCVSMHDALYTRHLHSFEMNPLM